MYRCNSGGLRWVLTKLNPGSNEMCSRLELRNSKTRPVHSPKTGWIYGEKRFSISVPISNVPKCKTETEVKSQEECDRGCDVRDTIGL